MTHFIRCALAIPHNTLPAKDTVVHTWSFRNEGEQSIETAASQIDTALTTFYVAIKAHLSSQYNWAGAVFSMINMSSPKPRYPFYEDTMGFGANTTTQHDWPAEVAVCLSMEGARVSGARQARRRGRVFLGPLQRSAGDEPTFPNTVADLFLSSAVTMVNSLQSNSVYLSVYSPYTHHNVPVGEKLTEAFPEDPARLDVSFVPVVTLRVDNAYDIQRRRGITPTYAPSTGV